LNLLACGPEWLWAEIWAHILPDDLTGGRDLEEAAVHTLVDEGVAVGQAPGIADERAVKSPFGGIAVAAGILPDDLLLDRIDLQRARAGGLSDDTLFIRRIGPGKDTGPTSVILGSMRISGVDRYSSTVRVDQRQYKL